MFYVKATSVFSTIAHFCRGPPPTFPGWFHLCHNAQGNRTSKYTSPAPHKAASYSPAPTSLFGSLLALRPPFTQIHMFVFALGIKVTFPVLADTHIKPGAWTTLVRSMMKTSDISDDLCYRARWQFNDLNSRIINVTQGKPLRKHL